MGKVISAISNAFSKIFSPSATPVPETPSMPDPNSAAAKLAAQKKIAGKAKGGRAGTIYSNQAYTGSNLAGTA